MDASMNLLPGNVADLQRAIDEANAVHLPPRGTVNPSMDEIAALLREIRDLLKPKPPGRPKKL
jgi:hypothetical protein